MGQEERTDALRVGHALGTDTVWPMAPLEFLAESNQRDATGKDGSKMMQEPTCDAGESDI